MTALETVTVSRAVVFLTEYLKTRNVKVDESIRNTNIHFSRFFNPTERFLGIFFIRLQHSQLEQLRIICKFIWYEENNVHTRVRFNRKSKNQLVNIFTVQQIVHILNITNSIIISSDFT